MTTQSVPPAGRISGPNPAFEDAELVFGLVAPVGTDFSAFENVLTRKLGRYHYDVDSVRMSRLMARFEPTSVSGSGSAEFVRLTQRMHEGSYLRLRSLKGEFLALAAASEILARRKGGGFRKRTAHVVRSLKHPDEVRALRRIYGPGFFLIGIGVPEEKRRSYLGGDKRCSPDEVEKLLQRDEHEENNDYFDAENNNFGQRTRDTFQLADVFVRSDDEGDVERFLDLVLGCPFFTPRKDEHAMFLAYAASLRSGDLSRQVGAVVVSAAGDVVAVGTNDVPRANGGLYWADDSRDGRDMARGHDSNEKQRSSIVEDVLKRVCPEGVDVETWLADGRRKLRGSPLMDITEYGRAVHAEMEAMMACTRNGVSPIGGTLYCTTFPCHNCAKHIVDAGITRVVYVEPYPKSQTKTLFDDSIRLTAGNGEKVAFEAFVGIGPRRFFDLFSLGLSSGTSTKKRKLSGGDRAQWKPDNAVVWAPLLPNSYLDRERVAAAELGEDSEKQGGGDS
jgi:deoxycytidylate deaminase